MVKRLSSTIAHAATAAGRHSLPALWCVSYPPCMWAAPRSFQYAGSFSEWTLPPLPHDGIVHVQPLNIFSPVRRRWNRMVLILESVSIPPPSTTVLDHGDLQKRQSPNCLGSAPSRPHVTTVVTSGLAWQTQTYMSTDLSRYEQAASFCGVFQSCHLAFRAAHVTKSIWSIPQTVVVAGRATFQDVGWSAKRGH